MKHHYFRRYFTYPVRVLRYRYAPYGASDRRCGRQAFQIHCQVGSLTGAVHLSNDNAGVLRLAQRGRKPRVEQKGKS
jgi:hypothetical protein